MPQAIVPIVEGQSEVESVPLLLRRILGRLAAWHVQVARPFRVKRTRVSRPGEIERAVKQAVRDREGVAAVLVLLDAEDDCPARLGPELLGRCRQQTELPVAVVLANRELEAWFLGAKDSLRGICGIRSDAGPPSDPEAIRGAKERLTRNMVNRRYVEVDDQPALAKRVDLDLARRRCASFNRLHRSLEDLVLRIPHPPAARG
jgi:hypothetical protein